MWDESSGKSKAGWIKISVKPMLVNRTIKVACWVERHEKLEHLPTSSKAKASVGIIFSTAPNSKRNLEICQCATNIVKIVCDSYQYFLFYVDLQTAYSTRFFSVFFDKTQFCRHPFRKLFNNQQFKRTKLSFNATFLTLLLHLSINESALLLCSASVTVFAHYRSQLPLHSAPHPPLTKNVSVCDIVAGRGGGVEAQLFNLKKLKPSSMPI